MCIAGRRDFRNAQDCLTRALALEPDDAEANYSLGMFYAQQDQMEPASEYLERAVLLRADYPEALNNLGVLCVRKQEYEKAEQHFKTCIRVAPHFDSPTSTWRASTCWSTISQRQDRH